MADLRTEAPAEYITNLHSHTFAYVTALPLVGLLEALFRIRELQGVLWECVFRAFRDM